MNSLPSHVKLKKRKEREKNTLKTATLTGAHLSIFHYNHVEGLVIPAVITFPVKHGASKLVQLTWVILIIITLLLLEH